MRYYKVIDGDTFIGVSTSFDLCKYKKRDGLPPIMLSCTLEEAQYIVCEDKYYHDTWLRPETVKELYPLVSVIEIQKDEFDSLSKSIEAGEIVDVSDPLTESIEEIVPIDPNEVVTLQYVKKKKLLEMNMMCTDCIHRGFDIILSDGEKHHFSLTEQDQLNLITLSTMISSGETAIPYHADEEPCKFYSLEDISNILNSATSWKTYHVTYNNSLKTYINSLEDIVAISAITYGIEIPEKYQSDVLKALLKQIGDSDSEQGID